MDLPETQRAGLTGCVWDSINHLTAASQGNWPRRTARGVRTMQCCTWNGAAAGGLAEGAGAGSSAGSSAERASAHCVGGVTGSTLAAPPAKVL